MPIQVFRKNVLPFRAEFLRPELRSGHLAVDGRDGSVRREDVGVGAVGHGPVEEVDEGGVPVEGRHERALQQERHVPLRGSSHRGEVLK